MLSRACAFSDLPFGGFFFCSAAAALTCSWASKNLPMWPEISIVMAETSLATAFASLYSATPCLMAAIAARASVKGSIYSPKIFLTSSPAKPGPSKTAAITT